MSVSDNLKRIKATIPDGVTLVAISKFHSKEAIAEAYAAGQRVFGESYEQELSGKQKELPQDIQWHFIGHLQSNKVKYIAPYISLIHSVDNAKLLKEVNKQAAKNNRVIDCLLQLHVAAEETKFGFLPQEFEEFLASADFAELKNVRVVGIMGMASNTDDETRVRSDFKALKGIFDKAKATAFAGKDYFRILSMGMSGDYEMAIEEGSNMVRIGSAIFGPRQY